jgi:hypothetical protein
LLPSAAGAPPESAATGVFGSAGLLSPPPNTKITRTAISTSAPPPMPA